MMRRNTPEIKVLKSIAKTYHTSDALGLDMNILLVDDSVAIRRVHKAMLHSMGMFKNIAEADDGVQALLMTSTEKYAAILLDWHMPGLNGMETLMQLKANPD